MKKHYWESLGNKYYLQDDHDNHIFNPKMIQHNTDSFEYFHLLSERGTPRITSQY